jgi:integrase
MASRAAETIVIRENEIRLVRRPDSARWQAHFKVDELGAWIRKATGTSDQAKAKDIAEKSWMRAKILAEEGVPVVSKKFKPVAQVVLGVIKQRVDANKSKRGSDNDYIGIIEKYLIPFFGSYNIDRLTPDLIESFHEWRRGKVGRELSASTQANHNAAMNLVLDYAVERGFMTSIQRPKLKNTGEASDRRPDFSDAEVKKLIEFMKPWTANCNVERTKRIRELLAIYVPFCAATGMRPGTEMEYLEWRHIDIRETDSEPVLYCLLQRGKTVKKGKSFGFVLHRSCWLLLERLRQMSKEFEGKSLRDVLKEKHALRAFRQRDGKQPVDLTKQFKQLLIDSDLLYCPTTGKERTLYSLRHYAITQLIARGATPDQLQQQVRTSAAMISKHYNHLDPLRNADFFSGASDDMTAKEDALQSIISDSPDDPLVSLAEMSTGLSLALVIKNSRAAKELADALRQPVRKSS